VIRPAIWDNYSQSPWGFIFRQLIIVMDRRRLLSRQAKRHARFSLFNGFYCRHGRQYRVWIVSDVLPASTDPQYNLTIYNTASPAYGLGVGLVWWIIGMTIAVGYFVYLLFIPRKTQTAGGGEGY
jgi:cytochrome d ubiquinol oxidase subunit II